MVHEPSSDTRRARLFDLRAIGRDYALLLAGFPWSLLTFTVLVPMFALSIGTLVIWVGALLLPRGPSLGVYTDDFVVSRGLLDPPGTVLATRPGERGRTVLVARSPGGPEQVIAVVP